MLQKPRSGVTGLNHDHKKTFFLGLDDGAVLMPEVRTDPGSDVMGCILGNKVF